VSCRFKEWKPGKLSKGKIVGVSLGQNQFMRPECFMISYQVEPLELVGSEHDSDESISECHTNTNAIPRIET